MENWIRERYRMYQGQIRLINQMLSTLHKEIQDQPDLKDKIAIGQFTFKGQFNRPHVFIKGGHDVYKDLPDGGFELEGHKEGWLDSDSCSEHGYDESQVAFMGKWD